MASSLQPVVTYPAIVGQVLSKHRKRAKLDQVDVAVSVGVTQSTWSRIERGVSSMSIEQLALASSKLAIPAGEIINEADKIASHLQSKGVMVKCVREKENTGAGYFLLGAAALGGLITAFLAAQDSDR